GSTPRPCTSDKRKAEHRRPGPPGRASARRARTLPRVWSDNVAVEQRPGVGPAHPPVLIGRSSELGEVERYLQAPPSGRMLVLSGDPGIGKTALWEAGVELA